MARARLVLRSRRRPSLVALPILWFVQGARPADVTIVLIVASR